MVIIQWQQRKRRRISYGFKEKIFQYYNYDVHIVISVSIFYGNAR